MLAATMVVITGLQPLVGGSDKVASLELMDRCVGFKGGYNIMSSHPDKKKIPIG